MEAEIKANLDSRVMNFEFPKDIRTKIEQEYEDRKNKLDSNQREIFAWFLDPNPEI